MEVSGKQVLGVPYVCCFISNQSMKNRFLKIDSLSIKFINNAATGFFHFYNSYRFKVSFTRITISQLRYEALNLKQIIDFPNMKKIIPILFIVSLVIYGCSSGTGSNSFKSLSASEFNDKINATQKTNILDVRTSQEFSESHIKNAINVDWNGDAFDAGIANLDKSTPVFVYCLSGGRSSAAAGHLVSLGYKEVYELDGGLMKWREANLPETAGTTSTPKTMGLTKQQFDSMVNSDKQVLVDFNADWCQPCQRLKPYIEEISKEQASIVKVISINADDNRSLCQALNINALPTLQLYKNKTLAWTHLGYLEKDDILKQLK